MSESTQPTGKRPGKKELSMEQRLLIAFVLMGAVVFLTPYLVPKPPAAPSPKKSEQKTAKEASEGKDISKETAAKAAAAPAQKKAEAEPASQSGRFTPVSAAKEETAVVETDVYRITFSNRGAVVRSWLLKKFTDSQGKPLELVNLKGAEKAGYPFHILLKGGQDASLLNNALWRASLSDDKRTIEFEYSDAGWHGKKTFQFTQASYVSRVGSELSNPGRPKPHLLTWRGGFGDGAVIGAAASQHSVHFDVNENKLIVKSAGDAKTEPLVFRGNYTFAGIEDAYFAAVAVPESSPGFEMHTLMDSVPNLADGKEEPNAGVALGGDPTNEFEWFVGPKDTDLLRRISPKLEQLVDWGWFSIIAKPLFLGMHFLHDRWIPNWGWTIVVITVLINFALLPLKMTSLKSMKQMQVLQPKIAEINAKYKGLSMRDPKKQMQNQEVMDLYKKHGVNPMGGCVPMVLQIPFFIAFYKVLTVAIELRGADWLWVTDLSQPETLPIRILPVAMIGTQFVLQKMTPSTAVDPNQQRIMMLMPLFLGFMFYGVSSGLVLYWLTGNLVGIGQQWFFNKTVHAPGTALAPAKKKTPSAK